MNMALFSAPSSTHLPSLSPPHCNGKLQLAIKTYLSLRPKRQPFFSVSTRATDNGSGVAVTVDEDKPAAEEKVPEVSAKSEESKEVSLESNMSPPPSVEAAAEEKVPEAPMKSEERMEVSLESNGSPSPPADADAKATVPEGVKKFEDPRWVNGSWDLKQFQKDGKTNWDDVIDAVFCSCRSEQDL